MDAMNEQKAEDNSPVEVTYAIITGGIFAGAQTVSALLTEAEMRESGWLDAGEERVESLPPEPRVPNMWAWRDGRWLRRAALLDNDNIFLGVDEVEPDKLTDRHVPQLFDCDNQPKRYRWIADAGSSTGGALHPVGRQTAEKKFTDTEPLGPLALMFIRIWAVKLMEIPTETIAWLDWYTKTVDFKSYWNNPEVYAFMHRNDEVSK